MKHEQTTVTFLCFDDTVSRAYTSTANGDKVLDELALIEWTSFEVDVDFSIESLCQYTLDAWVASAAFTVTYGRCQTMNQMERWSTLNDQSKLDKKSL